GLGGVIEMIFGPTPTPRYQEERMWIVFLVMGCAVPALVGAVKTWRRENYPMAQASCLLVAIMGLVTTRELPALIGIVAGIWAWRMLKKPEVKAVFVAAATKVGESATSDAAGKSAASIRSAAPVTPPSVTSEPSKPATMSPSVPRFYWLRVF